jgi:hypothetical protein
LVGVFNDDVVALEVADEGVADLDAGGGVLVVV